MAKYLKYSKKYSIICCVKTFFLACGTHLFLLAQLKEIKKLGGVLNDKRKKTRNYQHI